MIELKSTREIELMREAGRVVAGLLDHLTTYVRPGVKTKDLDQEALAYLRAHAAKPAFLGYRGFPATICVSINEEVVHGVPGERAIASGDLVSLDVGAIVNGFYADAATTVVVGTAPSKTQQLTRTTKRALEAGIAQAVAGHRLSDISHAVQQVIEREGFGVVRDFVGHGIGRALHEDPPIPNFGPSGCGLE